jgi:hypothetical protein
MGYRILQEFGKYKLLWTVLLYSTHYTRFGWTTRSLFHLFIDFNVQVLWWNLVLSCMRYRFPFSFLLQGSFEQNLIAPMPEDDS